VARFSTEVRHCGKPVAVQSLFWVHGTHRFSPSRWNDDPVPQY
jgi:hypothetical protein